MLAPQLPVVETGKQFELDDELDEVVLGLTAVLAPAAVVPAAVVPAAAVLPDPVEVAPPQAYTEEKTSSISIGESDHRLKTIRTT